MSGFMSIDIARRALQTAQYGLDVTAHNIANANTPGYSRQRVIQGTTTPYAGPEFNRVWINGMLGTGVEVKTIERVRDSYFDSQFRRENQSLGTWEIADNTLKQIETILNEPSDTSLQNVLGEFYNSWQQLSKNPESTSVRRTVIQTGQMVVTSFNQLDSQLTRLQENLNEQISVKVDQVNSFAQRIAQLNKDIMRATTFGIPPNDLNDQRDKLIDELSKIVDIQIYTQETGMMQVAINGSLLVDGQQSWEIETVPDGMNNGYNDIQWKLNGLPVKTYGGEINSLMESRDTMVPKYRAQIDALAATLVAEVNSIHSSGYGLDGGTGTIFFEGSTGADIALSADINDPVNIAASATGAPGDNANALNLAQLKNSMVMNGGTVTMDDYYRSIVSDLGIESQAAGRMVTNSSTYFNLIESQRQSVSGVSLDEEATNMIKFQRAYQAAAKIITITDQMLEDLINIAR